MGSSLFHGGTVLTVDKDDRVHAGGWISVRDGRITATGPRETTPSKSGFDEVIHLTGHLVMPGLVNAHTHSVMVLFRGRSEGQSLLTMEGWYNSIRAGLPRPDSRTDELSGYLDSINRANRKLPLFISR